MTRTQYRKSAEEILAWFDRADFVLGKEDRDERVARALKSFSYFFKTYLPHYAQSKSPKFHADMVRILEKGRPPVAIAAPRGFAKSTVASFAYVIWSVLRNRYKFVVIVSATEDLAEDLCEFIKLEFRGNSRIIGDFGKLVKGGGNDFTAGTTRILGRGRRQAVRGFRHRQHRPDLIILDDIEKDAEALNPKIVEKSLEVITRGLMPSLAPNGKIAVVGTILRKRSVMGNLLLGDAYKHWTRKIYKAVDDGKSLWEARFPLSYLHRQKELIGSQAFNAEYQNAPSDDENAMFRESLFKEGVVDENSPKVIFIDPSVDGIKSNDYKAGILAAKCGDVYEVVDAVLVQGSDAVFFERICSLYKAHEDSLLGTYIENNSFQKYYMKDLDNYAKAKNIDLRLAGISHYMRKELRIARLLPLFESGKILFNPLLNESKDGQILKEQLLYFPSNAVHDDAPDALAAAVSACILPPYSVHRLVFIEE